MNALLLDVPDLVRRNALSRGPQGAAWLRDLPRIVAELAGEWGLQVGRSLRGGTESFVVEARTAAGEDAVLKIALPGRVPEDGEARILMAAGGRGYVRALRHDARRRALLLERLGPQLIELGLPVDAQIAIVCRTLAEAWQTPPPAGVALPSGAEKARRLAAIIGESWEVLGRPCRERAVERALRCAELRAAAFDPDSAVLAHGDAHGWNTLLCPGHSDEGEFPLVPSSSRSSPPRQRGSRAGDGAVALDPRLRGGDKTSDGKGETSPIADRDEAVGARFKLIDPDGLVAERAYDLAIPMREWSEELLARDAVALGRRRCALLARLGGAAPEPIWQWALLERVANGLLLAQIGRQDLAAPCLRVAEAWAEER
jgi:streptomycin 6-kinase